jgi:hypothetical protein
MRHRTRIRIHLSVLATAAILPAGTGSATTIGASGIDSSASCDKTWVVGQTVDPTRIAVLHDVAAFSPTDAITVGLQVGGAAEAQTPLIEHWDGHTWSVATSEPTGEQAGLNAVDGASSDDVWAVGQQLTGTGPRASVSTLAEHWNGSSWATVQTPNAGQPRNGMFLGVSAAAADDVWAVGSFSVNGTEARTTLTAHFDGRVWTKVASPNAGGYTDELIDVDASPDGEAWAVGYSGQDASGENLNPLAMRFDGTQWNIVRTPELPGAQLESIAVAGPDDVWAVGHANSTTLALHWDGSGWSVLHGAATNSSLRAVAASAPDDVWAVGDYLDQTNIRQPLLQHWDGRSWTVAKTPKVKASDTLLNGVAVAAGAQVAVGEYLAQSGGLPIEHTLALHRCGA